MAQIKLGDLLLKAKVLEEHNLKAALAQQRKWGGMLGEVLVRMNLLTEDTLVKALSKQLAIPALSLDNVLSIPPQVRDRLPAKKARELDVLPLQLRDDGKTLLIAMADPLHAKTLEQLQTLTRCRILPHLAGRSDIRKAHARIYPKGTATDPSEDSFRVMDAQGRPLSGLPTSPGKQPTVSGIAPASNPSEVLRTLEEVQRKEVAVLKAMVELMIEKGVFTRDEYLAKVKR